MRSRRAFLALIVLVLAVTGIGCPCTRGVVNASPELRWWLFSTFAASRICPEATKRGLPLHLPALGAASIGRFFPARCQATVDDARHTLTLATDGTGYVDLPVARRVGFAITVTVEYLPDFRLEPDATYVWGRFQRFVTDPSIAVLGVENPVVNLATQTPIGTVATSIGNAVVASEIGRGFTVVRRDDGDAFALGHLEPPDSPPRPFVPGKDRVLLEGHATSLGTRERDYLGPFEVPTDGATLWLRARTAGGAVRYTLVERSVGEAWRRLYELAQPLGPPPGPVVGQGRLDPASAATLAFRLPRGSYYVVLSNEAAPPLLGAGEPALVAYGIELE